MARAKLLNVNSDLQMQLKKCEQETEEHALVYFQTATLQLGPFIAYVKSGIGFD